MQWRVSKITETHATSIQRFNAFCTSQPWQIISCVNLTRANAHSRPGTLNSSRHTGRGGRIFYVLATFCRNFVKSFLVLVQRNSMTSKKLFCASSTSSRLWDLKSNNGSMGKRHKKLYGQVGSHRVKRTLAFTLYPPMDRIWVRCYRLVLTGIL